MRRRACHHHQQNCWILYWSTECIIYSCIYSVLIKSKWICSTNMKSFLYRSRCGMTFFNWIIFFIVAIKTKFTCSAFKFKLMICHDTWNSNMRCANWKCAKLKNFDKNIHTFNNTCKHRPISAIVVCCCCPFFLLRTFTLIIYYVIICISYNWTKCFVKRFVVSV